MPLQPQILPVQFLGLAQKSGRIARPPGTLDRAINVEFQKLADGAGSQLNKRRGYKRVPPTAAVNRYTDDVVYMAVATWKGELVLMTYDHVAAVVEPDARLRGVDALVYRGPVNRGVARLERVSSSRSSQDYAEASS